MTTRAPSPLVTSLPLPQNNLGEGRFASIGVRGILSS
jgi:hypothetical protein